MIQSEHMKSCLTAQIRFMLFKGPGSCKKIFEIGGNVEDKQAHRLIPFTPPLLFHFTLPLTVRCIILQQKYHNKECHGLKDFSSS